MNAAALRTPTDGDPTTSIEYMKFAIFDLDHTLLPVDSCGGWTRWLADAAGMDAAAVMREEEAYARGYCEGSFDIDGFMAFQLGLLAKCRRADLDRWMSGFLETVIRPNIRPEALALLESRRQAGFELVLASGTHGFVTGPIARLFGIPHLVAAKPEETAGGEFTGRLVGSQSYQEGKLVLVKAILEKEAARRGEAAETIEAYSDSVNDLPLLDFAAARGRAVAVNPDDALRAEARRRGWLITDIFEKVDD